MFQMTPSIKYLSVIFAVLSIAVAMHDVSRADLIGYWPFDGDLLDHSGSGNNGTAYGDPMFDTNVPGALGSGQSVAFSGDDLVSVTQNSGLPISTQPGFTVSMWVQGAAQADKRIFSEGSTASNTPLFNLGTDNSGSTGAFDLFVRTDGNSTAANHHKSSIQVFDNTWHHIAFADHGGNTQLYIDGVMETVSLNYARGPLTLNTTTIGGILRAAPSAYFTGNIDDVAIWNSLLTEENIANLVAGTSPASIVAPAPPSPPVAPQIGDVFQIDIDTHMLSDGSNLGPISTADGWVSLDATRGNGSAVREGALSFYIGSADGSLQRTTDQGAPNPNPLTADFVYDDGSAQAVIVYFGRAGDLPAGKWQVDIFIYDAENDLGPQDLGFRTSGAETLISDAVMPNADGAAYSFVFESDGVSSYDVFLREHNDTDMTRINAVRLSYIPEPSAIFLLILGMCGVLVYARRQ